MGVLANFFTKIAKNTSTYCFAIFFEPEVPESLREE
ncbi:cyclic lactone autoinducer peptide [Terrisporobacter petrolearius]|nr:cyclic lactone autoinducer peptide [Terrisporobacter petrolearius]MCC3865620.1 cyclic lactone autoinducer peptide [Terrisporobacter petrolearius]